MNIVGKLLRLKALMGTIVPLLGAAVLAGCASTALPPAPELAASPDYLYKIGPLDSVNVTVWRNPELR